MLLESEIGPNIRKIRLGRGLSLDALAKKTGFSKGYLSKMENSDKAPPVSTMVVIAKALNVTISEILGEDHERATSSLVKKGERKLMARDGTVFGYSYETLAHKFPNKRMEPYILTIPANSTKSAVFQHNGEEMMMMLQGKMRFSLGTEEFLMEEGDCIYFDSSIPHYGLPVGKEDVKCVMVIYVP